MPSSHDHPSQTGLWLVSLTASVCVNAPVIFLVAYFARQPAQDVSHALARMVAPEPPSLTVLTPVLEAFRPAGAPRDIPAAAGLPEDGATRPAGPAKVSDFLETSSAQESSQPAAGASYYGERNTRASSNARPSEGASALPALDGREMTPQRPLSTFESHLQEGDPELSGGGAEPKSATPAATTEGGSSAAQTSPTGTTPVDRPQFKADQAVASQAPPPPVPEAADKSAPSSGVSPESGKTKVDGSIDTTGVGSEDVAATPEGRYEAALKRAIDSHWQVIRAQNRQYITSSMVKVRLQIEPSGKFHKMFVDDEYGASMIQKGLIGSSIRETTLPPMPPEVVKKLKGSFFETSISFRFSSQ